MNIRFFAVLVFVATVSIDLNCTLTERLANISPDIGIVDCKPLDNCRDCGSACESCGNSCCDRVSCH